MLAIVKPRPKIVQSVRFLEHHGVACVGVAPIDIHSIEEQCIQLKHLIDSGRLHTSTCIVTSTESAKRLVALLKNQSFPSRLKPRLALCVGESSAAMLAPYFQCVSYPAIQTSEGLIAELLPSVFGPVVLIKGQGGRQTIQTFLQQKRIQSLEYNVYRRIDLRPPFVTATLEWAKTDMIAVTSASLLTSLLDAFPKEQLIEKHWIVPSDRVKQVCILNGCKTIFMSNGATDKHLLRCIKTLQ